LTKIYTIYERGNNNKIWKNEEPGGKYLIVSSIALRDLLFRMFDGLITVVPLIRERVDESTA